MRDRRRAGLLTRAQLSPARTSHRLRRETVPDPCRYEAPRQALPSTGVAQMAAGAEKLKAGPQVALGSGLKTT